RASYALRSKISLRGSSAPSLGSLRLSAIPPKKQSALNSWLVPGSFVSVLSEWSNSHASGGLSIDRLVRVVTLVADCAIARLGKWQQFPALKSGVSQLSYFSTCRGGNSEFRCQGNSEFRCQSIFSRGGRPRRPECEFRCQVRIPVSEHLFRNSGVRVGIPVSSRNSGVRAPFREVDD